MKSVMISIKPKWCELIASGNKTIEVRKTRPKIEPPFKCYIYQTVGGRTNTVDILENNLGKVIGEFVCENIAKGNLQTGSCLSMQEMDKYANGKQLYGWNISDLVIYDKPKELSEFATNCVESEKCKNCKHYLFDNDEINGYRRWCDVSHNKPIGRPFQSWGYVEEIEE